MERCAAPAQRDDLPDVDTLVCRTTNALYGVLLGSLNASRLQTCIQTIMLLAWHELAHGFMR